ncbi:type VI secretion system Vgr family protein [Massilia cavernae]|uniref:Type VI secretion system tip protein VgrG n=1 Tax=Massilia cavernae TaxID=2320864 RepID=A0A418XU86_9BURK|nr:type VI secretion system Vgr family protein [Massilia cavernae]RJG16105.1 type VI secretion system tip protein VgrG [Massilia cavernae]
MNLNTLGIDLAGLTEANRPIRLRLWNDKGVIDDVLLVQHVSGVETMCGGIEYTLLCVSTHSGMALKHFIANPAELQFVTDSGGLRAVCGIIGSAIEGQSDGGLAIYQLILRDAFSLLEKTCNTRVFRNANEVDITNTMLREWRDKNPVAARTFDFNLMHVKRYPQREFTMQYNESNATFLRRLWKRRGIAWFIQPGAASERPAGDSPMHTLVLFDDPMALKENAAGEVRYHRDDGTEQRDSITAWQAVRTLTSGSTARQTWDYAQARSIGHELQSIQDQGILGSQFAASLDDYLIDTPHAGDDSDDYRHLGLLRMQRHEYEAKFFQGEGSDRQMCCGQWNVLSGHPEIDSHPVAERAFVVTELRVEAENNLPKTLDDRVRRLCALNHWGSASRALEQASEERGMRYTNRFTCVRRGIPIVPAYDPRIDLPRTEPQTVTVVGPVDEEIYCDEFGRVKVRFPACRPKDHEHASGAGASDSDRDSAWLRVSSGWAGARYGAISLPRAGDEVVVVFMGGDPDKPLIIGRVHGAHTPPPSFSHTSTLPVDKYLSGIKSKEVNAYRSNQLRMDDTPGQISAQLGSEHGHSQLNLGYLTQPRSKGKADARGEGAELRSDQAVAIRGGKGVLISADARLRAVGRQLERDGLNGLAEALAGVQKQLAELADTHHVGSADSKPLSQLVSDVKQWDNGSNTGGGTPGADGGRPVVAIEAPAGMLFGSQANVSIGAQTHVDVVSIGNTQLSSGRKLLLHAMQSVSLFAHKLGMKLTAASGKVEIQAHEDNIELTSAKRIVLVASDEIVIQAPKLTIVTQGAQAAFGGGRIQSQCTGEYAVRSANVAFTGAGDGSPTSLNLAKSVAAHDQRVRIVDLNTGEPLAKQRYRAKMEDGQVFEGTTDADGLTEILKSEIPFAGFEFEALFKE